MAKSAGLPLRRLASAVFGTAAGQDGGARRLKKKWEPSPREKWLKEVNENPKCTPMTFRVAFCLSESLNWKGIAWQISQVKIAQMAHTTVRTVQEHIAILKAECHLDVRVVGGDRHNGNEYTRRFRDRQPSLPLEAASALPRDRKSADLPNDYSADMRTTVRQSHEPQFVRLTNHSSHTTPVKKHLKIPLSIPPVARRQAPRRETAIARKGSARKRRARPPGRVRAARWRKK